MAERCKRQIFSANSKIIQCPRRHLHKNMFLSNANVFVIAPKLEGATQQMQFQANSKQLFLTIPIYAYNDIVALAVCCRAKPRLRPMGAGPRGFKMSDCPPMRRLVTHEVSLKFYQSLGVYCRQGLKPLKLSCCVCVSVCLCVCRVLEDRTPALSLIMHPCSCRAISPRANVNCTNLLCSAPPLTAH